MNVTIRSAPKVHCDECNSYGFCDCIMIGTKHILYLCQTCLDELHEAIIATRPDTEGE
jgi:hypothetical protein